MTDLSKVCGLAPVSANLVNAPTETDVARLPSASKSVTLPFGLKVTAENTGGVSTIVTSALNPLAVLACILLFFISVSFNIYLYRSSVEVRSSASPFFPQKDWLKSFSDEPLDAANPQLHWLPTDPAWLSFLLNHTSVSDPSGLSEYVQAFPFGDSFNASHAAMNTSALGPDWRTDERKHSDRLYSRLAVSLTLLRHRLKAVLERIASLERTLLLGKYVNYLSDRLLACYSSPEENCEPLEKKLVALVGGEEKRRE